MKKNKRKKKRLVLGEGYPWYNRVESKINKDQGYYSISLLDKPGNFGFPAGTIQLEIKGAGKIGAWKKVRLVAEYY